MLKASDRIYSKPINDHHSVHNWQLKPIQVKYYTSSFQPAQNF